MEKWGAFYTFTAKISDKGLDTMKLFVHIFQMLPFLYLLSYY